MTTLPDHRRLIHGRTHSQAWRPAEMDPIRQYPARGRWASRLLATAIGIALALVLVRWVDWSLM